MKKEQRKRESGKTINSVASGITSTDSEVKSMIDDEDDDLKSLCSVKTEDGKIRMNTVII